MKVPTEKRAQSRLARTIKPCDGARDATSGNTDNAKTRAKAKAKSIKKINHKHTVIGISSKIQRGTVIINAVVGADG